VTDDVHIKSTNTKYRYTVIVVIRHYECRYELNNKIYEHRNHIHIRNQFKLCPLNNYNAIKTRYAKSVRENTNMLIAIIMKV